jgi:2-dehydro-3-deoxyphosphogluconate aldolase/(4S)-4-hydroxy-2-oxoglutarate aldolase
MMDAAPQAPTTGRDLLGISPVIPVVVIEDEAHAVPLAGALLRGGITVIEVTLRTPAGLPAIRRIAEEAPRMLVGAGTVTTPEQACAAARAGARFLVTPGAPPRLLAAALDTGLPVLPGASTLTETMALLEQGLDAAKFFPAEACGGAAYLRAVAGPLPEVAFCPTGGITPENATDYLQLANVGCVGGSWLTPAAAVREGDWRRIEQLAAQAAALATRP